MDADYEEIVSKLIRDGFTSGYEPCDGITSWSLNFDVKTHLDENQIEIIADLVADGFTSGYGWDLELNE